VTDDQRAERKLGIENLVVERKLEVQQKDQGGISNSRQASSYPLATSDKEGKAERATD